MIDYLTQLNQSQYKAVTTNAKYARVIAGAGSGKTRVLTSRIIYLISSLGIQANQILAITFTNKAASEMKKRVESYVDEGNIRPFIATFHAFCVRFLREEIKIIDYPASFPILDDEDQEKILKQILEEQDIAKDVLSPKQAKSYISNNKSANVSVERAKVIAGSFYGEQLNARVYEAYEKELNRLKALDFDDLILKTCQILKANPNIRDKWCARHQYLLVDEFQDTNDIQYLLVKLLMNETSELFVVGDPDQTIYTWRGANVNLILNFDKDFKGAEQFILNENYRSTKAILDGANQLISNNRKRIAKDLITNNSEGGKTIYYQGKSQELEAKWVCERIKELRAKNKKIRYQDIAILYRSNYYSRGIEDQLIKNKIPYVIYGGIRFFERREIKDALAYLRLVVNSKDDLAFDRIINTPKRGIGAKALDTIKDGAKEDNISEFEYVMNNVDSFRRIADQLQRFVDLILDARNKLNSDDCVYSRLLDDLLETSGYYKMCKDEDEEDRIDNLKELVNLLFIRQGEGVESVTLDEILQDLALYSAQDEMNDTDSVILMTVHTAKGLEFPYVFLVGLSEGVFPSAKTIVETKDGIEEERRLAYVAFTRAMKQLFLSDSEGYNYSSGSFRTASRFISEVSEHITPYFGGVSVSRPVYSAKDNEVKDYGSNTIVNDRNYHPGQMVVHRAFGEGVIISVEKDSVRVAFKDPNYGVKLISSSFAGLSPK
jgi:DNA helicase-2/ATP-dependent DNA helicase PcrA